MNYVMMPRPPHWITVVQGLGPTVVSVVIGLVAAGLAYRQWKTAHQKLVVDMFDRRFAFMGEMQGLVKGYLVRRDIDDAVSSLRDLQQRSRYLFGADVTAFFEEIISDINRANILEAANDEQAERSVAASARLLEFHLRAYTVFGPYMSLAKITAPGSR